MKYLLFFTTFFLISCASTQKLESSSTNCTHPCKPAKSGCPGNIDTPAGFIEITDTTLLNASLGDSLQGGLCKGKVFEAQKDTIIYRAWNSTNPGSKQGHWWSFLEPQGSTSMFQKDYVICYQWSPLDRKETCTLKAGSKIVVGTGQSACCSQYLTYDPSPTIQVYIDDASQVTTQCSTQSNDFNWK